MTDIAIVGEAWGADEERQRAPFVGASGYLLTQMLAEAGIDRGRCFLTNVFNLRPKDNDIETLCVPKSEDRSGLPPLRAGKYLQRTYLGELDRLFSEIKSVHPNIIFALGNTATWALLHNSGISKIRGSLAWSSITNCKVLPTYHPAAILRDWSLRPVTILDFAKGLRESSFREIRRPTRTVYIEPSLQDIEDFYETHIAHAARLAFDIETAGNQITCIGFAPSHSCAIVIPFVDLRKPGGSYWLSLDHERHAWSAVRKYLASPARKIGQNTLYDIHFLWRAYGITVNNYEDDTMLMHHALQPESNKGLGFLGSVYTNESSWKLMNARGKKTIKRED